MRRYPLDVLLVNDDPHNYRAVENCHRFLHRHPAVRSYGIASMKKALFYLSQGRVNTLLVSTGILRHGTLDELVRFIAIVESEYPRVVVVIYSYNLDNLIQTVPEFRSYFKLDPSELQGDRIRSSSAAEEVLAKCERWHETRFDYDIAISFAGEDRWQAENIAAELKKADVRVFYDQYEQSNLLGKDLYVHLYEIYAKRSRYCVLLSSEYYLNKMWTIHERRAAQERTLQERGGEYILPVRLDDSEIPGIPSTIGYIYASDAATTADTLVSKLWLTKPVREKRYIGYSLYDYDAAPLMKKVGRTNYHGKIGVYVPPSWQYELIREKEEADKSALSVARAKLISALRLNFHDFAGKIESQPGMTLDEIFPGLTAEEIAAREEEIGLPLPESYKQFLHAASGFWLSDGAVQFSRHHPYLHKSPEYESLSPDEKAQVSTTGGIWPPPSSGMLCFAEFFIEEVGCSVLFDVRRGLINGEYPVMNYYYRATPPSITPIAQSFSQWLNERCLDDLLN
jgi:hypothetical protein